MNVTSSMKGASVIFEMLVEGMSVVVEECMGVEDGIKSVEIIEEGDE